MAKRKKKRESGERVMIALRVKDAVERDWFHDAADSEGFSTMAAWAMYHLRNQARQTLADSDQDSAQ